MKNLLIAFALWSFAIFPTRAAKADQSSFETWWSGFQTLFSDQELAKEKQVFAKWWDYLVQEDPTGVMNMYTGAKEFLEAKEKQKRLVSTLIFTIESKYLTVAPDDIKAGADFSTFWNTLQEIDGPIPDDEKKAFIYAWNTLNANDPTRAKTLLTQIENQAQAVKAAKSSDNELRTAVERWYLSRDDNEFKSRWVEIQAQFTVIYHENP